ncbi:hypothetical protein BH24CHL6_BH24CHL6_13410 [soil metagenome]
MPHAVEAASAQPTTTTSRRAQTWLARVLGVFIALALLVPVAAGSPPPAAAASRSCTGWTSKVVPPTSIRVLRRDGVVATVDFKKYVGKVMASGEWPSHLPAALLRSGAQASKQFAWYHSLKGNHRSSFVTASGKCYDVVATTRDQLYKPGASVTRKQKRAVNAIWDLSLYRDNKFILTPYRAGTVKRCAADVDGKRLYAKSARRCAAAGWSSAKILRTYYGGDNAVALVGGPIGSALSADAWGWESDPFAAGPESYAPLDVRVALPGGRHTAVVGQVW